MKNLLALLCLTLSLIGCKTGTINQKENKKRVGLWIEDYSIDSTQYKSVGNYKNGDPIKKWCYYTNNKIYKKEIYRKNKSTITYYYPNGVIQSKGKTELTGLGTTMHWFYKGDWKYFDEKGKLISISKYDNGKLVSEVKTPILQDKK
ncbi:hypothetical protein [Flavobacterium gilvum]|uniref:MORN repeat protein n=1 Tax=Flavobacterium gilvum TaxID=1492737 RepID=A0AAC9N665_9FLAO|nr:hypothetical protein [Flavobacterium gilvum]AOW08488.1 hypothetical protein EM308_02680 [Flavobacterium gilvum]KFC58205.1 hypothetical protein FEM08_29750 [Flavobacterium gilvum]